MTAMITTPTTLSPRDQHLAVRSGADDFKAFPAVLRSEWIKLSTLRANRAILALTILAGGFTSWAVATLITDEVLVVSVVYIYSTVLTAVFAAVAGILLFTSEAQHGTLAATLTAQPARWVIAAAKTVTATTIGLVLGAGGMAAGYVGAVVGGLELGDTSGMAATTLWALLFTSLAALFGLGVGMIVRHTATADSIAVALSRPENALLFGGYTLALLVIGTVLLYRRDTN